MHIIYKGCELPDNSNLAYYMSISMKESFITQFIGST